MAAEPSPSSNPRQTTSSASLVNAFPYSRYRDGIGRPGQRALRARTTLRNPSPLPSPSLHPQPDGRWHRGISLP
eukprot:6185444-Pleurochrysis_carterae.AAC.2